MDDTFNIVQIMTTIISDINEIPFAYKDYNTESYTFKYHGHTWSITDEGAEGWTLTLSNDETGSLSKNELFYWSTRNYNNLPGFNIKAKQLYQLMEEKIFTLQGLFDRIVPFTRQVKKLTDNYITDDMLLPTSFEVKYKQKK